jgi:hypothetical protein
MQVRSIPIGNVIARVVYLNETGEGMMTSREAYNLLGIKQNTYSQHSISICPTDTIPEECVEELRNEGIIARRGRIPSFITKSQFKELVKRVNTAEAWNIYNTLWDVAETHIRAVDSNVPVWAADLKKDMETQFNRIETRFNRVEDVCNGLQTDVETRFNRVEDVCGGLRREVDELKIALGMFMSEESDADVIQKLIQEITSMFRLTKSALIGKVRSMLNLAGIYHSADSKRVIKCLQVIKNGGIEVLNGGLE